MPPNTKLEGIVQYAVPYQDDKNRSDSVGLLEGNGVFFTGRPSQSNPRATEDGSEGVRNITSTARFTYTLDRFQRNAMLLISSSKEVSTTMHNLNNSFRQYRFDVQVIEANKCRRKREILDEIYSFFQLDFAGVGAVAVVFLTSSHFEASAELRDGRLEKQDLMQYFTTNQPAGLLGKPKIFIEEGICISNKYLNDPDQIPLSTSDADLLIIQANVVYGARKHRPLDLLCSHLNLMKGDHNLVKELPRIVWGAGILFPKRTTSIPLQYKSTLTKQLLLERCNTEAVVVTAPTEDAESENQKIRIRKIFICAEKNLVKHVDMVRRRIRSMKLKDRLYTQNILTTRNLSDFPGHKVEVHFDSLLQ